jgi:histidine ammonia-lyase
VLEAALVIGALTVDAARGSDGPFDPRIHACAASRGRSTWPQYYRELLAGSAIRASHLVGDDRVQDPYCLRCQPQVVGACLDQLRHARKVLVREANAVTDNPLVFSEDGHGQRRQLPRRAGGAGGRRHGLAIAEVGAIAERRIAMLIDPASRACRPS